MKSTLLSFSLLLLLAGHAPLASAQSGAEIKDQTDMQALRVLNLFMEACVMGHTGRQGRLATLDSHPALRRMPVPPGSAAAQSGRLIWGAPPHIFIALDPDLNCTIAVNDESIKNRLGPLLEHMSLGKSGEGSNAKFAELPQPEDVLHQQRQRNVQLKTYLFRKPDTNIGVFVAIESSIKPSPDTDPVRMSARYVSWDKSSAEQKP